MSYQNVTNALVDAITASGKKFTEIGKDAIFGFLKREGVSEKHWGGIYESLEEIYGTKKKKNTNMSQGTVTMEQMMNKYHVDYSDSSHNDVKVRHPRKSVFSEIKKIAG